MSHLDKHTVKDILRQIVEGSVKESNGNFNFRCPLCGDSKKSKSKKRGWVLFKEDNVNYFCHNCNASLSFVKLLKENYPHLYNQYVKNKDIKTVLNLNKKDVKIILPKKNEVVDITDEFNSNSFNIRERDLDKKKMLLQYEALKLVIGRKIPKKYVDDMRVCYDGKFNNRLLIPYHNQDGDVYCYQGRTLVGSEPKYLTYKPENNNKIFNFYIANPNEIVYITEGPVDAFFIGDQCLATSGIANYGTEQYLEIKNKFPNRLWVFDNDIKGIETAIEYAIKGEYVFCWRKDFKVKDINDLVLKNNLTNEQLIDIINKNKCTKFEAVMKMKMGR